MTRDMSLFVDAQGDVTSWRPGINRSLYATLLLWCRHGRHSGIVSVQLLTSVCRDIDPSVVTDLSSCQCHMATIRGDGICFANVAFLQAIPPTPLYETLTRAVYPSAIEHYREILGYWPQQNLDAQNLPTIILVPLMLSHLLVHLPPRPLRSQIALFSMSRLISGINFHLYFVNQFHLFMLTSIHPSIVHFLHPSPLHSFTLNSKRTSLVNPFHHRWHSGLTSSANGTAFRSYSAYRFSSLFLLR